MNNIFLIFLSLSLSGSLIGLLLLLLKPIMKDRLSKTWQYYIYLIVIARLLLPFGPNTSLMDMIFQRTRNYTVTENPMPISGGIPRTPGANVPVMRPKEKAVPMSEGRNMVHIITKWLWLAWLVTGIGLLLQKIIAYQRFTRAVKASCSKIECSRTLDIYKKTCLDMSIRRYPQLVQNEQVAAPMLVGIITPVIVLPNTDFKCAEMQFVFRHELNHYKRLDIFYKWSVQIAVCLHWFNPLIYRINREINHNCELACDEAVIRQLDEQSKYIYGDMLLESIKTKKQALSSVVSMTLSEDGKLIKERLGAIMKYKKKTKAVVAFSAALAVMLMFGAACSGVYGYGKTSPSHLPAPANKSSDAILNNSDSSKEKAQTVIYDSVEMRRYKGKDGHPYIHEVKHNNTDKTIVGYKCGMLAFDKKGRALKIDWWSLDTSLDSSYYYLYSEDSMKLKAGQIDDVFGGFSLNFMGIDPAVKKIAYVLYCHKEISFGDGTVWKNPNYKKWLADYKGKKIDVEVLKNYYPYEQKIEF